MKETVVMALKKIDNNSAPEFRKLLMDAVEDGAERLIADFQDTAYISSAGLRVLLEIQKLMKKKGLELVIRNVRPVVMEVFDITGFSGFLNFEEE